MLGQGSEENNEQKAYNAGVGFYSIAFQGAELRAEVSGEFDHVMR